MKSLREALVKLTGKVYHYFAPPNTEPDYIIWSEDGSNDLKADNVHAERAWTGVVDLYTNEEGNLLVEGVANAFEEIGAAYNLVSVDYEEDTGLIHYSWDWELPYGYDPV